MPSKPTPRRQRPACPLRPPPHRRALWAALRRGALPSCPWSDSSIAPRLAPSRAFGRAVRVAPGDNPEFKRTVGSGGSRNALLRLLVSRNRHPSATARPVTFHDRARHGFAIGVHSCAGDAESPGGVGGCRCLGRCHPLDDVLQSLRCTSVCDNAERRSGAQQYGERSVHFHSIRSVFSIPLNLNPPHSLDLNYSCSRAGETPALLPEGFNSTCPVLGRP